MRVLVAGDLHGVPVAASRLVDMAKATEVDEVWQVGDLGFWPREPMFGAFIEILDQSPVNIYFADGNHEDHHALGSGDPNLKPRPISDKVWHQPRGTIRGVGDHRVLFFGGAQSVDETHRQKNVSWFSEELPNYSEWHRAADAGKADVVVAHEAPDIVGFGYPRPEAAFWPTDVLHRAAGFREALTQHLLPSAQPDVWFHGHHHQTRYTNIRNELKVYGLNCDGISGTFAIYDLDRRHATFVTQKRLDEVVTVRGIRQHELRKTLPVSYKKEAK